MIANIIIDIKLFNYNTDKYYYNINSYLLNKIKEWYYERLKNIYHSLTSFKLVKIVIKNKKLKITFKINKKDYLDIVQEGLDKIISDPDDDVNYPIKYKNIEYAVIGVTDKIYF